MIKEINYETAKKFIDNQDTDFYLQKAEIQKMSPDKIKFLGYFKNNELKACCSYYDIKVKKIFKAVMIIKSEVFVEKSEQLLIDYYKSLVSYFSKCLYIYIYPTFLKNHRDNFGSIVEESSERKIVDKVLKDIEVVFPKREKFMAANTMYIKRVIDLDIDSYASTLGSNVRKMLKQAKNKELYLKELKISQLDDYYYLLEESSQKQNFDIPGLEKLKKELNVFKENMKLVAVCVDKNKIVSKLEKLRSAKDVNPEHVKNYDKLLSFFYNSKEEDVPLGLAVFYEDSKQISYEISGSLGMFNNWGVIYYLMIEKIKEAKKQGKKYYNFGGLTTSFDGDSLENDGVYNFKKKFNGEILEYYPEFIIPVKRRLCRIFKI